MGQEQAYPSALSQCEDQWIKARRKAVDEADTAAPKISTSPRVGLAFSGGGIRSATFGLGVLQSLVRHGLLKRVDYLSTVSGGGYLGGFLGRLFTRDYVSGPQDVSYLLHPEQPGQIRPASLKAEAPARPFAHLRNNGNYLAPNGGSDMLGALAVAVRNWAALHVVLASFMLMLFLALQLFTLGLTGADLPRDGLPKLAEQLTATTGPFWRISPWLDLLPPLLLFAVLPLGWAYWLIHRREDGGLNPAWGLLAAVAVAALASCFFGFKHFLPVVLLALLTVLACAVAYWCASNKSPDHDAAFLQGAARNYLSRWLTVAFALAFFLLAWVLIDSLGLSIYQEWQNQGQWIAGYTALFTALTPLLVRLGKLPALLSQIGVAKKDGYSLPLEAIATVIALVLGLLVLSGLDAISHGLASDISRAEQPSWCRPLAAFAALFLFAWLFGRSWPFINRSSLQSFYAARLSRAYLGASNPERFQPGSEPVSVTESLPDDDLGLKKYGQKLCEHGGPLHLINLTINETTGDNAKTVVRDRKGMNLAVGPCGLSAGVKHHALHESVQPSGNGQQDNAPVALIAATAKAEAMQLAPVLYANSYQMFASQTADGRALPDSVASESLSLGQWVAISGAAFTTGLGAKSTAALAWLLGFANVRLGYWWNSGKQMAAPGAQRVWWRRLFPLQTHLLNEFTARFHGSHAQRWYLSDGGHFENMAAYELIRRRLPVILVVDGEADPDYGYEGLANLVRKVRLDFGAEIEFLAGEKLTRALHPDLHGTFGSLDELRPGTATVEGFSQKRAALAKVRYHDNANPDSLLLYLKPTLSAGDPADVREYRKTHPDFPQQTTLDQFFDEAQWESYRRLGLAVGDAVFKPPTTIPAAGFLPYALAP